MIMKSGLVMTSASSLSTCGCIPSGFDVVLLFQRQAGPAAVSTSVICLFDRALSFSNFVHSIFMFLTLHSAVMFLGSFPLFKLSTR